MIVYNTKTWFRLIFRLRGSALAHVWQETLSCMLVGWIASFLHHWRLSQLPTNTFAEQQYYTSVRTSPLLDPVIHKLLGVPFTFLLVFRSRLGFKRYWEGRSLAGALVGCTRNLMRQIASYIDGDDEMSQQERAELRRLLNLMYAVIRQHIQLKPNMRDLDKVSMCTPDERRVLVKVKNRPMVVAQWFSFRLYANLKAGRIHREELLAMEADIKTFVAAWMGADKIVNTPMPYPYVQMLNLLLAIFVYTMPFCFSHLFGYFCPIAAGLIAFAIIGINAVAMEVENPFGTDANDLPMDTYGAVLEADTESILKQRDPDTEKFEELWGVSSIISKATAFVSKESTRAPAKLA